MCGIAGILSPNPSPRHLSRGLHFLKHRGPDEEGFQNLSYRDEVIGLVGHRRLSIIDVSGGHQPWTDETGSLLTFNGEIYNFSDLKRELDRTSNHHWKSHSDTEVLFEWLKAHGKDGLSRINGMFAFAFWDAANGRLLLARDTAGEKPLYYSHQNGSLLFASELRSILSMMDTLPKPDPQGISDFLTLGYFPSPRTPFEGVSKLEPGQWIEWSQGKLTQGYYWSVKQVHQQEPLSDSQLDHLISDSVNLRLIGERPFGIFLSGGVDSSLVAAYASRLIGPEKTHTFSIGFDEKEFDETEFSNAVAKHLKVQHHHKRIVLDEVLDRLPDILAAMDEPTADASFIPTYLLSEFASEKVVVALGGDGGDELFAGYKTHFLHRMVELASALPLGRKGMSVFSQLGLVPENKAHWLKQDPLTRHLSSVSYFESGEIAAISDWTTQAKAFFDESSAEDVVQSICRFDFRFYLGDGVLQKVDRASMAHSLEVRAPLLDRRLVDYGLGLASSQKISGTRGKMPLRRLLAQKVPKELWNPKKQGFSVPLAQWFEKALDAKLERSMDALAFWNLDPEQALGKVSRANSTRISHRKWMLYILAQWVQSLDKLR